ncbi:MAG: lysylphosphatidylglycerol synthase transmembrane domain-containing protein [Atopobiaceae bacterium]|nr:lysylphosphatidylglycerol synthase transmembrane domain-containing protein [Atopobiaceae bacterium]
MAGSTEDADGGQVRFGAKFILVVIAGYVAFLAVTGQMGEFVDALASVDLGWVIGAFVMYALSFCCGVSAYVVAVWLDPDSPCGIRDLMSVEASGVFFVNLTPLAAGSVPDQIFRLTRAGLDVGEATVTQITRFAIYQAGEVAFSALMLLLKLPFFLETYGDIVLLCLLIFLLHLLQLLALFFVCMRPKLVMRFGNWAIGWVARRGWFRKADYSKAYDLVNVEVKEVSDAFARVSGRGPRIAYTGLITLGQLTFLYSIPWFVLNAFGIQADFLSCLAATSMVQLIASAVPLPGGTGGAEGGFALFFGPLMGGLTTAGFLVWRVLSYFLPTGVSALFLSIRSNRDESIYQRWNKVRYSGRRREATQGVRTVGRSATRTARNAGSSAKGVVKAVTTTTADVAHFTRDEHEIKRGERDSRQRRWQAKRADKRRPR